MEVAELYGLRQYVDTPTHTSGNTLHSMFTTEESSLKLSDLISSFYMSDHCFVSAKLFLKKPPLIRKKINIRKLKLINTDLFRKS